MVHVVDDKRYGTHRCWRLDERPVIVCVQGR